MNITWLGHSCFRVENKGYTVVFDPTEDGYVPGVKPIREKADMVVCSHEHGDHNARHLIDVTGGETDSDNPQIVIGEKPCPYKITSVHTFHDDKGGSLRGENIITVLDDGEFKIAHFGDLGCFPKEEELQELKGLDVALIPVGGFYTIDGKQAAEIIKAIKPKVTIPMHFRDDDQGFGFDVISTVEDFAGEFDSVEREDGSSIELTKEELEEAHEAKSKIVILSMK